MVVSLLSDEEEGVANDSDSSPPQHRGRGRFEKGRAKVGSRGQSEDSRSTSSQAADEESSSHVRHCGCTEAVHYVYLFGVLAVCGLCESSLSALLCVLAREVTSSGQPRRQRPALWLLPCW